MTGRADATVLIDNERVRVTQWRFAPGAATGWHSTLRLVEPDGTTHSELRTGAPYFRETGVEHDVVNADEHEFTFIEIEIRR